MDNEIAESVAREVASSGDPLRVTVRSLRERFGRARLTASGRAQIADALKRAGITLEPDLERASLDEYVLLRLAGAGGAPGWRDRFLRGGVRAWKVVVALLGLLATVAGLYTFVREWRKDSPSQRLTADMNIAVAPFTARGDAAPSGELLARQVRSTLGTQLKRHAHPAGVTFDLAPPPRLDPVQPGTVAERTAAAERVAARLNAQIVVYGDLRLGSDRSIVAPKFYLAGQALGDADELIGSHRLGAPAVITGSVSDNVAARVEARRLLAARTRTLSDFVVGLSYFARDDYESANRWFRQARTASDEASEVIYLFLGHVAGRSGEFLQARRFYGRALEAEPEYARARFGIAEVQFQRSRGRCSPGSTNAAGLRSALRGYLQAEAERREPYGDVLQARARFGRARTLFCLAQAGIEPRFPDAEALYRFVVRAYEGGEPVLRDEASEALAGIGLIRLPGRGERSPGRELREAEAYYKRALRLSGDQNRQALFSSMLGFIYSRLGEKAAAEQAYRRAARLDPDPGDRRRYERHAGL
jgi:tetratricopeptide (TPR) repeat protein